MVKRYTRNRKQKRNHHRTMKGGSLSEDEIRQLEDRHFDAFDIDTLRGLGISFNEIMQAYDTTFVNFEGNSDAMIQQVMLDLTNQYTPVNNAQGVNLNDISTISNVSDNSFESQGSLHLSDLDVNPDDSMMSGYTDSPDESGGKRLRKSIKRKIRKGRKTRRNRRRNLKGGTCFGTGVGANNYDPNLSIYNTNMLKLFPYKPN